MRRKSGGRISVACALLGYNETADPVRFTGAHYDIARPTRVCDALLGVCCSLK